MVDQREYGKDKFFFYVEGRYKIQHMNTFSIFTGAKWYVWIMWTVGWVNLYKKSEIEKYTVCNKLILTKKWKDIF